MHLNVPLILMTPRTRAGRLLLVLFCFFLFPASNCAQPGGIVLRHSHDSSSWLKFSATIQAWARYTDHNPGSAIAVGNSVFESPSPFDIGIRRARFQLFGQVAPRVFLYSQFGINNFSHYSARKSGAFFHDLVAEYTLIPGLLSTGGGLTGWSGLSRYASPSVASTLMYDAPLFHQATNDVNEQFLRKLSLYAKGKLSRLDYRVALSKPMPLQTATGIDTTLEGVAYQSKFSPSLPRLQSQAYINWQFLEQESNLTPYTTGTYAGTRNVFNLGAGIIFQPEAMRYLNESGQIVHAPMRLLGADVFYDRVLNRERKTAITGYAGFFSYDFGPNHIRTLGVMNTANVVRNTNTGRFSGAGNAYAMFGTGNILHMQAAYKTRNGLFGGSASLQPYADIVCGLFEAFSDPVITWNAGINFLLRNPGSRVSLNYQERPVFIEDSASLSGKAQPLARRGMVVLLYQVAI